MTLITFDENKQIFIFQTHLFPILSVLKKKLISVIFILVKRLKTYHDGRKYPAINRSFSPNPDGIPLKTRDFSLDTILQEMPSYGHGDFRNPAVQIKQVNGSVYH